MLSLLPLSKELLDKIDEVLLNNSPLSSTSNSNAVEVPVPLRPPAKVTCVAKSFDEPVEIVTPL